MKTSIIRSFVPLLVLTGALASSIPTMRAQATAQEHAAKKEATSSAGLTAADKKLILAAAESDEAEISAAKIAMEKTSNPKIKEYAQMMVDDHSKSTEMLKPIAEAGGITMPPLKAKHKEMAAELKGLSGDAFDKSYVKGNVKSHGEILATIKASKSEITNPELKKFTEEVTPIIEHHLMMANALK